MGEETLGFKHDEVGTHSIRSGGAMAMKLANINTYTIKLIGCWKSDYFLRYIQKQVREFSSDISDQMIKHKHFSHIPGPKLTLIRTKLEQRANKTESNSKLDDNEEKLQSRRYRVV